MDLIFLYLLFVSIAGVIAIVWRIIANQKHLDQATLRLFILKQLGEKQRNQVISHLGICEKCQELMREYMEGKPLEDHLIEEED